MLVRNTVSTLIFNQKYTVATLCSLSFTVFHVTDFVKMWKNKCLKKGDIVSENNNLWTKVR
jgi:hypothetical protein